ncbi:MAG: hypothetical protein R3F46_11245 [bacterium]
MSEDRSVATELFEGRIERLGWGGVGITRHTDGRIILLRHALALFPGELVRAEIEWKARHAEGRVLEIIEADAQRIAPICPWAAACGGCDLQGAPLRGTELKRLMVADLLAKQLGPEHAWEWSAADDNTLRNVIQLHLADGRLGYHARGSHELVEIGACTAARPGLSAAIEHLRAGIASADLPALEGRWELVCGNPEEPVIAWHESDPRRFWELTADGWQDSEGRVSFLLRDGAPIANLASGFFQTSGGAAIRWFRTLFARWQLSGDRLHDLYGGCGLFSRLLCDSFSSFSVVDSSEVSITSAVANLSGQSARCFQRDVDSYIERMQSRPNDLIILDPPRSGLSRAACKALCDQGAGALVLIGCDGAAFCRDLARLDSGWRLEKLEVADLFPWTVHCEFAALLLNRAG